MLTELLSSKGKVVTEEMFARDLKDGAREDFGQLANVLNNIHENLSVMLDRCVDESVSNCIISDMKDEITKLAILDENYYEEKTPITRALLQIYGTQIFRDRVDVNYWVNQVMMRIANSQSDYIFVTDVRFPNEIDQLVATLHDKCKFVSIRIDRPMDRSDIQNEHESEKGLDDYDDWSIKVKNDRTMTELSLDAIEVVEYLLRLKK
jgi:hypothetical protein